SGYLLATVWHIIPFIIASNCHTHHPCSELTAFHFSCGIKRLAGCKHLASILPYQAFCHVNIRILILALFAHNFANRSPSLNQSVFNNSPDDWQWEKYGEV